MGRGCTSDRGLSGLRVQRWARGMSRRPGGSCAMPGAGGGRAPPSAERPHSAAGTRSREKRCSSAASAATAWAQPEVQLLLSSPPTHPNPSGQRRQSPARLQVGSALRGWAQLCGVGSGSGSPAPGAGKGRKNQQVEAPPLPLGSPRSVELCFCSEELSRGFSGDVG